MTPPTVIVHGRAHAAAALAAAAGTGIPVRLVSAPGAAATLGAETFARLVDRAAREHPGAVFTAVLDCGGDAGYALGALDVGIKALRLDADDAVLAKVAAIAAATGATVEPAGDPDPVPDLDLDGTDDPESACRAWLRLTAHEAME